MTKEELTMDADLELLPNSRILLVHPIDAAVEGLRYGLECAGYRVAHADKVTGILPAVEGFKPQLVVAELHLVDGPTLPTLRRLLGPSMPQLAILTAHDSMATAVTCANLGVRGYWVKPVDSVRLIRELTHRKASVVGDLSPMRLDRAVWEYINQVVETTGSVTQAAVALGIDKRSLRRMLGRYAPPACSR